MPWTFAHPAAVLPLRRLCPRRLSLSALAKGSITPDAGYYVGQFTIASLAHTPLGLVVFCLPTGLCFLLLMGLVQQSLVQYFPQPHRSALARLPLIQPLADRRRLLICVVSILFGAATHVIWDAFTHETGFVVQWLPVLQQVIFKFGSRDIHVFNLLQHMSTLLGVTLLLLAYRKFLYRTDEDIESANTDKERYRYALIAAAAALLTIVGGWLAYRVTGARDSLQMSSFVFHWVIYSTNTLFVVVVVVWIRWIICQREPAQ